VFVFHFLIDSVLIQFKLMFFVLCAQDDVVPESFYNLQLITSIFLWLFCGELLLLWVSVQIISCCTQRHGLCLSVEQVWIFFFAL
jgi:hypothetical protein